MTTDKETQLRAAFDRAVRLRERLENALREAYKREWEAGAAWQAEHDKGTNKRLTK